ncbi:hypothetical protein P154DRAFT_570459 [Amniculicola lignicola CBS 123094]|uniref:Uncharacterized protein n=1 Tax=Amniculicola lignicola CBS 123094 TaxID=1392246 RepID=A0A6A5X122_9PLEO|nr:hypothetical protein P154DRAFT_570459 [Amniculicola lignicola CBS 123094]
MSQTPSPSTPAATNQSAKAAEKENLRKQADDIIEECRVNLQQAQQDLEALRTGSTVVARLLDLSIQELEDNRADVKTMLRHIYRQRRHYRANQSYTFDMETYDNLQISLLKLRVTKIDRVLSCKQDVVKYNKLVEEMEAFKLKLEFKDRKLD